MEEPVLVRDLRAATPNCRSTAWAEATVSSGSRSTRCDPRWGHRRPTIWEYPGRRHVVGGGVQSHDRLHPAAAIRCSATWTTRWPRSASSNSYTAVGHRRLVVGSTITTTHDHHEKPPAHLARRRRHRSAVVLPRAHRFHCRRRDRQVRLHHTAPDLRGRADHQVFEDGTGANGRGGAASRSSGKR